MRISGWFAQNSFIYDGFEASLAHTCSVLGSCTDPVYSVTEQHILRVNMLLSLQTLTIFSVLQTRDGFCSQRCKVRSRHLSVVSLVRSKLYLPDCSFVW